MNKQQFFQVCSFVDGMELSCLNQDCRDAVFCTKCYEISKATSDDVKILKIPRSEYWLRESRFYNLETIGTNPCSFER